MRKIRVIVVDDSALMRSLLRQIIDSTDDMEVVAVAPDPLVARERIRELDPDVITLDIEMPQMDGLTFLERLMRLRPTPVLMVSSLTEEGAEATLRALELGAIDFVCKPDNHSLLLADYADEICHKIRAVALAGRGFAARRAALAQKTLPKPLPMVRTRSQQVQLIVVGASTGGTEALKLFLQRLPADSPPVLIVQHMPPGFTTSFAARLDSLSELHVSEAKEGEPILPGHAYLAPGDRHLQISKNTRGYVCHLDDSERVNRHKPAVDVLFDSVTNYIAAKRVVAVLMTGMGKDGAAGLLRLRQAGATTLAQDEASCVVFGMPGEAIKLGAVQETGCPEALADRVVSLF